MTPKFSSSVLTIALVASLAATLSACVPLVVGGAAMSAMVAVDRRTSGAQLEDEGIELRGASRLRDTFGDRAHINITSYNRQVLLTGEVPNDAAKQQAEQVIARVENVKTIVNELGAAGNSTLVQRSSDVLITGKIKASLVDAKDLYAGAFKVVTERSTVYLMGRVTPREADRATSIARQIDGVQRVVRIFEVISDDEMRRVQTQIAPTAPTAPISQKP
ncbi:MAG: BON domain-containing protein [Ramlibacter sp.]|nr:BON domain-containing protein [Ramlibacter sp.]